MPFLRYYCLVVRTALTHSLSIAQNIIFVSILVVGAAIHFTPQSSMSAQLTSWATALNGWAVAAIPFGAIITLRLLLAPYWIWKEQDERIKEQDERIKPRIDVSYDCNNQNCHGTTPVDIAGSQSQSQQRSTCGFFRLRVTNTSALSISDCGGFLKEVTNLETGEKVESQHLLWASGPSGAMGVTLVPNAPMYLDCAPLEKGIQLVSDKGGHFAMSTCLIIRVFSYSK